MWNPQDTAIIKAIHIPRYRGAQAGKADTGCFCPKNRARKQIGRYCPVRILYALAPPRQCVRPCQTRPDRPGLARRVRMAGAARIPPVRARAEPVLIVQVPLTAPRCDHTPAQTRAGAARDRGFWPQDGRPRVSASRHRQGINPADPDSGHVICNLLAALQLLSQAHHAQRQVRKVRLSGLRRRADLEVRKLQGVGQGVCVRVMRLSGALRWRACS